jgi:autophagy-related protein 9
VSLPFLYGRSHPDIYRISRILRQENYLTALFNKDILDLHVRIPLPRQAAGLLPGSLIRHESEEDRFYLCFGRNSLTQSLEWNLRFCLLGFMFDERRHVRKEFVRGRNRDEAVAK